MTTSEEEKASAGTVLVVDDIATNIDVAVEFLSAEHFTVLAARNGESALQKAAYAMPEIILLDVMMPGLSGFEVCERLKADPVTRDIPVIFMTGLDDVSSKLEGFRVGAADYVTKPFEHVEVLARISAHMTLYRLQQQLRAEIERSHALTRQLETRGRELEEANRILESLANMDGLTRLANRRYLEVYLDQEWRRMRRNRLPLAIILCDVDFFKRYNDTYGHPAGDECLKQVASCINSACQRPADLGARYGGEEFMLILPETDSEGALQVAENLRAAIAALALEHRASDARQYVTLSQGVASALPAEAEHGGDSQEALIARADAALYQSKQNGRDRVSCA